MSHPGVAALAETVAGLTPEEHGFAWFDPARVVGHGHGDLGGMIIPAKDLHDVAGMPTSHGSSSRTYTATHTDPFLQSLIDRGAIIAGKTQTSELGMTAYCEPVGMPAPDNPRLPGHTPGGSSGGAAVAVARGLVDAAHASDGGGSIRVPAAACGLVGLKPAHDSRGGTPVAQGFLTRDLATQARLHRIPPTIRPLRIGVLLEPLHANVPVDARTTATIETAAGRLEPAGHRLSTLTRPYGTWAFEAFTEVLAARSRIIEGPASPIVTWLRELGLSISTPELRQAVRAFDSVGDIVLGAWDVDVVISPTLAFPPPPLGHFSTLGPEADFPAPPRWTPRASPFHMLAGPPPTPPPGIPPRALPPAPPPALIGIPGLALYVSAIHLGLSKQVIPTTLDSPWWEIPVLLIYSAANAFGEEIVVVMWLMTRLRGLGWTVPATIAASAILRGSYHLYQGVSAGFGNIVMGVVFAWFYHRTGKVWPLVIAHFLIDAVAFVGYSALGGDLSWLGL